MIAILFDDNWLVSIMSVITRIDAYTIYLACTMYVFSYCVYINVMVVFGCALYHRLGKGYDLVLLIGCGSK